MRERAEVRKAGVADSFQLSAISKSADAEVIDTVQLFNEIVRRIRDVCDPERIVLFGSHARGDERPDSGLDILVIRESDEPRYRRSAPLYSKVADLPVEVEYVVYTPEEVAEWSEVPQAFVTRAVREGKVLYQRAVQERT